MTDFDRKPGAGFVHSPWLKKRETLDGGFSAGWGMHFVPSETYWLDIHNHFADVSNIDQARALMREWFGVMDAYRLGQSVMIIKGSEHFDLWNDFAQEDPRFAWIYWPDIDAPDVRLVERAAKHGAVGLKLHNVAIMRGESPADTYHAPAWRDVMEAAQALGLPLLWHVTQRMGFSPYHGGGENAYWTEGWARGVTITNEDLLGDMLSILKAYPDIRIIGAHQLHLGLTRLDALLDEHKNLYIDSSCGFTLRWADDFIDQDRAIIKAFVEKHAGRILFGTDSGLSPGNTDEYLRQAARNHMRFFLRLGLQDETLQAVAWANAKALLRLPDIPSDRRGNVRP